MIFFIVELPFCEGYSKYITAKNLDFKSVKAVRKDPDPLNDMEKFHERYPLEDIDGTDLLKLTATQDSRSISPRALKKLKERRRKERAEQRRRLAEETIQAAEPPAFIQRNTGIEEDWRETIRKNKLEGTRDGNTGSVFGSKGPKPKFKSSVSINQQELSHS